jgi:hypothetical protein
MGFIPILSNPSFSLPVVLLTASALVWWWMTKTATPPRLVAAPPFHSWRVNPAAAAYDSLRQERYLLAAYLLRERLAAVAQQQFQVDPEDLRTWAARDERARLPAPLNLRRVLKDLTRAYRSAYVAEAMRSSEWFAAITLPLRRRQAARDFDRAARGVELVLAAWRGAP